jgi:pimeloyl-ACP methyl ester carboxylesterase
MKKISILVLCNLLIFVSLAYGKSILTVKGPSLFSKVSIGGPSGEEIWAIASSTSLIYRYTKESENTTAWVEMGTSAVRTFVDVSVAPDGNAVWAVAEGNRLWKYTQGKGWARIVEDPKVSLFDSIAVGGPTGEEVWAIASYTSQMYRYEKKSNNTSAWVEMGTSVVKTFIDVSIAPDGEAVWAVAEGNRLWKYTLGKGWKSIAGDLKVSLFDSIAAGGTTEEEIWAIASNTSLVYRNTANKHCNLNWTEKINAGVATFIDVSVAPDGKTIWGVAVGNKIWKYSKENGWVALASRQKSDDLSRWMSDDEIVQRACLRKITIPGAHDAGMGITSSCSIGANGASAQTQDKSMIQMLNSGIRYFDIRPIIDHEGDMYAGHYSWIISRNLGCYGYTIDEILHEVANFVSGSKPNNEVIILKMSHFMNFQKHDNANSYFDENDFKRLRKLITCFLGEHLVKGKPDFMEIPIGHLTKNGARVIVTFNDEENSIYEEYKTVYDEKVGIYPETSLNLYDEYSDTNVFENMKNNQMYKLREYSNDKYFILSWTLTLDTKQVIICAVSGSRCTSIKDLADIANNKIHIITDMSEKYKKYPGVIYTDFVSSELAEIAKSINNSRYSVSKKISRNYDIGDASRDYDIARYKKSTGLRPVIFIHGHGNNEECWKPIFSKLLQDKESTFMKDYAVYTFQYPSYYTADDGIMENGVRLKSKLTDENIPTANMIIVAHSRGGLVARAYIAKGGNISKLVTFATPHYGTDYNYGTFATNNFKAVKDMMIGSPFIKELRQNANDIANRSKYVLWAAEKPDKLDMYDGMVPTQSEWFCTKADFGNCCTPFWRQACRWYKKSTSKLHNAIDIAVCGKNGEHIWAVASGGAVWEYDSNANNWRRISTSPTFHRISIGGDKGQTRWTIADGGAIWKYQNKKWIKKGTSKLHNAIDIAVGGKNGEHVWAVASGGAVWAYDINANNWRRISTSPTFQRISIGGERGEIRWTIADGGAIWKYQNKKWIKKGTSKLHNAIDIAVGGENGEHVWAVASGGAVWAYDVHTDVWARISHSPTFQQIAIGGEGGDESWAIADGGAIWSEEANPDMMINPFTGKIRNDACLDNCDCDSRIGARYYIETNHNGIIDPELNPTGYKYLRDSLGKNID